jgi:hypothetical protein
MSKRLQVVVGEAELAGYTRTADAAGLSLSEWARQALRLAERATSSGDVEAKLGVIRAAVAHSAPEAEADIDEILAQAGAGHLIDIETGTGGTAGTAGT